MPTSQCDPWFCFAWLSPDFLGGGLVVNHFRLQKCPRLVCRWTTAGGAEKVFYVWENLPTEIWDCLSLKGLLSKCRLIFDPGQTTFSKHVRSTVLQKYRATKLLCYVCWNAITLPLRGMLLLLILHPKHGFLGIWAGGHPATQTPKTQSHVKQKSLLMSDL